MSDELKNILSNLNNDIEQEKLLEYLNRKLSAEEEHDLEKSMQEDPFVNDAMDGLSQMQQPDNIPTLVHQLNKDLKRHITKKKKNKRRSISEAPWLYYTVIILLLLAVLGYVVIKKYLG